MHRPSNQKKLKEIALKHGISLASADEIISAQWLFLKNLINSVDIDKEYYPVMAIQHLGKFVVTEKRKWINRTKYKTQEDDMR